MKWIIDGKEFTDARDAAEYIMENLNNDVYDNMLDECYGEINICGYFYSASTTLYNVDPVAYLTGKNDYYDSLERDIKYDLERLGNGDTDTFYGLEVECVDEFGKL